MANSSAVYVRMDPTLKEAAEDILAQLGITSSGAVQMFYKQIVLHRGLPFSLTLPDNRPVAIGGMSHAQIDEELNKGMESLQGGGKGQCQGADRPHPQEYPRIERSAGTVWPCGLGALAWDGDAEDARGSLFGLLFGPP